MSSRAKKPTVPDLWDDSLDGAISRPASHQTAWKVWMGVVVVASVFWLYGMVATFSDLTVDLLAAFVFCGFGFLLGIAWLFWTLGLWAGSGPRDRVEVKLWAFVLSAGLLGLTLMLTEADNIVRLKLSEPALRRTIAEARPDAWIALQDLKGQRVGLYWLRSMRVLDGRVELTGEPSYPAGGLIYCPAGRPPQASPEHRYWHLYGPWWRFEQHY